MSKKKNKAANVPDISVFNWFITLLISVIPGVNILFFIFSISFARTATKRHFAVAALILSLLLIAAAAIMLWFFSYSIVKWANSVLSEAAPQA